MGAAQVTTDHHEIREWVEQRGGLPARVKQTGGDGDPGILRIDFPGFSGGESLERVSWEDWFQAFEDNKLAFLHQDQTEAGDVSRFNKLVSRDRIGSESGQSEGKKSAPKRPSARRGQPS
jgi:hypothetical protein